MSVDEARIQLRGQLQELFGVSGAEILMDQPPGGWNDLVTNHTLDLRFAAFEERVDRKFDAVLAEMRAGFAAVEARFALERADRRAEISDLRADMDRRFRSQTLVMLSAFTALMGVMVAAIRI